MSNISAAILRGDLVGAGWIQLSTNTFERRGFTARLDLAAGTMIVVSPIGARRVRKVTP